jgi:hypothetical protein
MVVDHIGGHSPLYMLTGGDQFFTSAAEAFITIFGFLVGVVYGHLAETRGLGVALRRLLERAWLMYLLAVGLTLLVLPVSAMLHLPWSMSADLANPREVLWRIFTLHQTTYLADVALLYALLLAVAPCAFVLLSEGRPFPVAHRGGVATVRQSGVGDFLGLTAPAQQDHVLRGARTPRSGCKNCTAPRSWSWLAKSPLKIIASCAQRSSEHS